MKVHAGQKVLPEFFTKMHVSIFQVFRMGV